MGDRANVVIPDPTNPGQAVYLYTHWGGSELPDLLARALARGSGRWDDPPYLARIIFSEMVRDDIDGETGYGISTGLCDNEYPLFVVDTDKQVVRAVRASWEYITGYVIDTDGPEVPFAEATGEALRAARGEALRAARTEVGRTP